MTTPGPGSRFLYVADVTDGLGLNLMGTLGQVGDYNLPAINETLQELTGSGATFPTVVRVGHSTTPDVPIPLYADSALQDWIDKLQGVTAADRKNLVFIVSGINTDTIGEYATCVKGYLASLATVTPVALVTEVHPTFRPDGVAEIAIVLHELSAETADGDTESTSVDNSASSSAGGAGWFLYTVLALDGGTAFAPRVIDSADDITFGELIAFTAVTGLTGGGERKTVTGTVEQYVACDWDFTGAPGGSETCTFWIGFARY